jgi:hypothetical protein
MERLDPIDLAREVVAVGRAQRDLRRNFRRRKDAVPAVDFDPGKPAGGLCRAADSVSTSCGCPPLERCKRTGGPAVPDVRFGPKPTW